MLVVVALVVLAAVFVRVVPSGYAYVVRRNGQQVVRNAYRLYITVVEEVVERIPLKEQVCRVFNQPTITRDNITVFVHAVVHYAVTDVQKYAGRAGVSITHLLLPVLRSVVDWYDFEDVLDASEQVAMRVRDALKKEVYELGIDISSVDIQSIRVSEELQSAC